MSELSSAKVYDPDRSPRCVVCSACHPSQPCNLDCHICWPDSPSRDSHPVGGEEDERYIVSGGQFYSVKKDAELVAVLLALREPERHLAESRKKVEEYIRSLRSSLATVSRERDEALRDAYLAGWYQAWRIADSGLVSDADRWAAEYVAARRAPRPEETGETTNAE